MAEGVSGEEIREAVRERYAAAARQVKVVKRSSCCSGSASADCCGDSAIGSANYDVAQLGLLPQEAVLASLGCGNPTLLAQLKEGETVLDLGSGGGIDVLLSARRVGSSGKAYGLDMTDEMLELARSNARAAGVSNVEFLKGQIESIPLPNESVDVIISNCVINLSADKDAVLSEAFRVLKPGGRFAVADIVVQGGPLPAPIRRMMSLWAGCISGALREEEYRDKLVRAGFSGVEMEVLKVYSMDDVPEEMRSMAPAGTALPEGTRVVSSFIRATKGGEVVQVSSHGASLEGEVVADEPTLTAGSSDCCGGDQVKEYFKEVATRWDQMREGYFTEEVRHAAIARASLDGEAVVADVGTGTGFMLAGLAPLVKKAYGFDSSPEMLAVARQNLGSAGNVELTVAEGTSIPLPDGALDAVFANMYLHHAPDPAAAVAELARLLKPGGRLVITDMDRHDHEWMMREMADLWPGFDRPQVEAWYRSAGLEEVVVESTGSNCCGSSCSGNEASIGVFVASGTMA